MQNHFKIDGNKSNFEHCKIVIPSVVQLFKFDDVYYYYGCKHIFNGCMESTWTSTEAHQTVRIPVSGADWSVVDGEGNKVAAQVQVIGQRTLSLPLLYINHYKVSKEELPKLIDAYSNKATHVLTFSIGNLPPMGYKVFTATAGSSSDGKNKLRSSSTKAETAYVRRLSKADGPTTVSNGVYELTLDPTTGMTTTLKNIKTDITTDLEISWGWYNSSVGGCTPGIEPYAASCDGQASGAYMFRPNTSTVFYPENTNTNNNYSKRIFSNRNLPNIFRLGNTRNPFN